MTTSGRHRAPPRRRGVVALAAAAVLGAGILPAANALTQQQDPRPGPPKAISSPPSTGADDTRPRASSAVRNKPATASAAVPTRGSGSFTAADGKGRRAGSGGRQVDYRVEVEGGLGVDAADFAAAVEETLADERGWTKGGGLAFRRTRGAALRIVLASPATTDRLCAPLQTRGKVSCRNGNDVVINALRWRKGVPFYDDLGAYRDYVVNHEVGHALGFGHQPCPAPGRPAPVMLQQTLGLQGCAANPWP